MSRSNAKYERLEPISLWPLKPEEAIKKAMQAPPMPSQVKPEPKKRVKPSKKK